MPKLFLRGLAVLVLALGVAGCAQFEQHQQNIAMQDRTNSYRKAIRWSEYDIAKSFIQRQDESAYEYDADFYNAIRVVENEIESREMFSEEGFAKVYSKVKFYHVDYNTVTDLVDEQLWWYDEETENWYLDGGFPNYKAALGQ